MEQTKQNFKSYIKKMIKSKMIEHNGFRAIFDDGFCSGNEIDFIDNIEDFIDSGNIFMRNKTTTIIMSNHDKKKIVIKKYNNKGWFHSIRHSIKGSRAQKNLYFSKLLQHIGIKTPKVLLCLEKTDSIANKESYIIMEHVEGLHLREYLQSKDIDNTKKQQAISKAKGILEKLHSHRTTHNDPKLTNLIVNSEGIYLIDLDSMIHHSTYLGFMLKSYRTMKKFKRRIKEQTQ